VRVKAHYYRKENKPRIYISLFDTDDFRGEQMNWVEDGEVNYDLWVSPNSSSRGGIPGPIPSGDWFLQLDISLLNEIIELIYEVEVEFGNEEIPTLTPQPDHRILNDKPGWYAGELHAHTNESDGDLSVEELLTKAFSKGLDFIAITDHFTSSAWWRIGQIRKIPRIVWLNSLEITSHQGHANIHGIKEWIDVFVDKPEWSMNDAANETHRQGGLFCVNHAFSGELGWSDFTFDWSKADLFEIYHCLEGANNIFQLSMWDSLLREGHRIIGVAGSDYHGNQFGDQELAPIKTYVYAQNQSVEGLLDGLRNGRVFVSFGSQIEFNIQNSSAKRAVMGQSIEFGGRPVELEIRLRVQKDLKIYIIKNGFAWHSFTINKGSDDSWQTFRIMDEHPIIGYYRLEIHEMYENPEYQGLDWRDYKTIQALSNPIWLL